MLSPLAKYCTKAVIRDDNVEVNNPHCVSFIKFIIVEVTDEEEKGKLKFDTKKKNQELLFV